MVVRSAASTNPRNSAPIAIALNAPVSRRRGRGRAPRLLSFSVAPPVFTLALLFFFALLLCTRETRNRLPAPPEHRGPKPAKSLLEKAVRSTQRVGTGSQNGNPG